MDTDLFFVIGLIIAGFSIPPIIGALSEGRAPRTAAIAILIGGGLVALAVNERPGAYSVSEIPDAFVRVVGRYIN
ncbi:hypothetical protein [Marivivens marinus]|uniref:hypothetical protein n=1 Tax=Marivivens marinus TaxID=3110173 RepID=UPI003B8476CC